ncbi:hypothetical protein HY256_07785 [Candidatus Sumerlaeota bacterium]|nr:hypothetical protein [Candidatus Sumerlaeota bacterium]
MLEYRGQFPVFDFSRIKTYDLNSRPSKVLAEHLAAPEKLAAGPLQCDSPELRAVAAAVKAARANDQPVMLLSGAHLIKNGFGPLFADLIRRRIVTLVGMNAAGMIHDLELALIGKTSEDVPRALPRGEFGFAEQTGRLINGALAHGEKLKLGAGEALGRLIQGEAFPEKTDFPHRNVSLLAAGIERGVPVTIHASIGTDIVDQFPNWDPSAKGGCSGRDFAIFCAEAERMSPSRARGGVFLNIGTAVMGPEVFLKACSMCANVGHPPAGVVTASFDIRPADMKDINDERAAGYYYRDIKSVVVRIPQAFGGRGHYVQGDHLDTLPALFQLLVGSGD